MARVAEVLLFGAGVYVCLRSIAAAYRVLDLWYAIGTAWPKVVRGLAGWGGGAAVLAAALDGRPRAAFLLGMAAFLVFYLSLYLVRYLVLRKPAPLE